MTRKKKTAALGLVSLLLATSMFGTAAITASADALKYDGKYYSDYTSVDDVVDAAEELNIEIASEGMVLLKNDNDMLPFQKDVKNLSVFGVRSDNLLLAGTGTGSVNSSTAPSLQYALESAGFCVNPTLLNFYANDSTTDPLKEISSFTRSVTDSYKSYNDAAIVVLSRVGGENADVATSVAEDADTGEHINGITKKHYLELTNAEQDLLKNVAKNFKKVVLVLNSSNPIELKEIDQEEYGVDAAIWMSQPGQNGVMALGKILNGEVNPSGKLVDFFERDFTSSIVWNNYGTGEQAVTSDGKAVYDATDNPYPNVYRTSDGIYGTVPQGMQPGTGFTEVQYEEGIYLGYKFYETMWYEKEQQQEGSGDAWYDAQTMYPFGYGLSYTTFKQTIEGVYKEESCTNKVEDNKIASEKTVYVKVKVENTGEVAGKDVVQIYVNAPYTKGGIEKSYVKLVGMGKSEIIKAKKSDTVVVKVNVQDMASYDYNDANKNSHTGYELEAGTYNLFAMKNSHEQYSAYQFNVSETKYLDEDDFSGNKIENLFSQDDEYNSLDYYNGELQMTLVSRADFIDGTYVQPQAATKEELTRSYAWFDDAVQRDYYAVADDGTTNGGYSTTPWADEKTVNIPDEDVAATETSKGVVAWTQGTGVKDENGQYKITLSDMTGVDFDDPLWDTFLNQLTWDELKASISSGAYGTVAIDSIGKEATTETDGPISLSSGFAWCVEPLQAATWNADLLERLGVLTANQAMLRWQDSSYSGTYDLAGWYGPAMNIHRSHFLGRTFEYYSEDGILGGYMGSAVVGGAQSKGLNCWIKHFVLNDQEIYRKGINTYCTEQAMREMYFVPFQMSIQEGNATGIMTSFNRVGQIAAAVNYRLLQGVVRDEWGFDGTIVTDLYNSNCWPSTMLLRAGNDLPLGTVTPEGEWDADERKGKGSVKVSSVSNFSIQRAYKTGDYVTTGEYVSRSLVLTYYKVTKDITANTYKTSADAIADGALAKVEGEALTAMKSEVATTSNAQYYYVRMCAKRMLYTEANIMAGKNGYDLSVFADKTLTTVEQGSSVSQSVAVDMKAETATYTLIGGELPEGLTLNANGTISGTPVGTAGTYEFTVRAVYDGWIRTTANFKLEVTPAFTYTETAAAEAGKNYYATIDTAKYEDSEKTYTLVGELPAGLTFNAQTGEIEGKPTAPGTYNVTVVISVKSASSGNESGPGAQTSKTSTYNLPIEIKVGGTVAAEKTEIELIQDQIAALETSGASASDLAALKDRVAALEANSGSNNADTTTSTASSGCGSVIGIGAGAMALGVMAAASAVAIAAKKRKDDDK